MNWVKVCRKLISSAGSVFLFALRLRFCSWVWYLPYLPNQYPENLILKCWYFWYFDTQMLIFLIVHQHQVLTTSNDDLVVFVTFTPLYVYLTKYNNPLLTLTSSLNYTKPGEDNKHKSVPYCCTFCYASIYYYGIK